MNLTDLRAELAKREIDARWYSFVGPEDGERFCLVRSGQQWEAYYAERGEKSGLRIFEDESDACTYFLQWILKDPAVGLPKYPHGRKG